jgi:hypothetical protein
MPAEFFLIGYGTLLHRGSLGRSIGQDSAARKRIVPVVVRGYRRLFNLRPTHYETSHKLHAEPIENAAMNVEPADTDTAHFNGLGFTVTLEELRALDARERYYSRKPVPIHHFETNELVGEGHLYVSDPDADWIERDPAKLMPLWRDIVWARTGAYRVSESFGRCYDETTYLADGSSLVSDRYREVLDDTSDVELPG